MASATTFERARRSGVSQSRARSSKLLIYEEALGARLVAVRPRHCEQRSRPASPRRRSRSAILKPAGQSKSVWKPADASCAHRDTAAGPSKRQRLLISPRDLGPFCAASRKTGPWFWWAYPTGKGSRSYLDCSRVVTSLITHVFLLWPVQFGPDGTSAVGSPEAG
jgi:hypothetical protein